jgi:hypothetical protein
MVPYILVIYVQLMVQLDVLIMYSLFLSIFSSTCFGCYCIHPQELQLQPTAIGVCNGFGVLIHWSRYWLGHPRTFTTVRLRAKYGEE